MVRIHTHIIRTRNDGYSSSDPRVIEERLPCGMTTEGESKDQMLIKSGCTGARENIRRQVVYEEAGVKGGAREDTTVALISSEQRGLAVDAGHSEVLYCTCTYPGRGSHSPSTPGWPEHWFVECHDCVDQNSLLVGRETWSGRAAAGSNGGCTWKQCRP
jgi:hypothetical protein